MTKPSPHAIAANLSSLLYLAQRKGGAEGELQEGVRVLLAALGGESLVIESTIGWLTINGVRLPSESPGAREVNEQFLANSVSRLEVPSGSLATDLLASIRTLSVYPGVHATWDDLIASLGAAADRIRLTPAGTDLSIIQFDDATATAIRGLDPDASAEYHDYVKEDSLIVPPLDVVAPGRTGPRPERPPDQRHDPAFLARLLERGRSASHAADYPALLAVASELVDEADRATSEAVQRVYLMELKRLLSRKQIAQFAKLAAVGSQRETAINVLRRVGGDATEVLMDLLVETNSRTERRGYYSALTKMHDGTEVIIHHLEHPVWYVVRNAAELCGELALAQAVPKLAAQATHSEERVRKSVAVALNRIGTREALEPLSRMLKDPSPAIRLQVLGNLDGALARPLAMPLAVMLETEEDPDVLREVLRTLGRIGTPDALLALQRVAQGGARRLGRRGRLQAIEALQVAGTAAAQLLRGLAQDTDSEIAEAATRALEGVPA